MINLEAVRDDFMRGRTYKDRHGRYVVETAMGIFTLQAFMTRLAYVNSALREEYKQEQIKVYEKYEEEYRQLQIKTEDELKDNLKESLIYYEYEQNKTAKELRDDELARKLLHYVYDDNIDAETAKMTIVSAAVLGQKKKAEALGTSIDEIPFTLDLPITYMIVDISRDNPDYLTEEIGKIPKPQFDKVIGHVISHLNRDTRFNGDDGFMDEEVLNDYLEENFFEEGYTNGAYITSEVIGEFIEEDEPIGQNEINALTELNKLLNYSFNVIYSDGSLGSVPMSDVMRTAQSVRLLKCVLDYVVDETNEANEIPLDADKQTLKDKVDSIYSKILDGANVSNISAPYMLNDKTIRSRIDYIMNNLSDSEKDNIVRELSEVTLKDFSVNTYLNPVEEKSVHEDYKRDHQDIDNMDIAFDTLTVNRNNFIQHMMSYVKAINNLSAFFDNSYIRELEEAEEFDMISDDFEWACPNSFRFIDYTRDIYDLYDILYRAHFEDGDPDKLLEDFEIIFKEIVSEYDEHGNKVKSTDGKLSDDILVLPDGKYFDLKGNLSEANILKLQYMLDPTTVGSIEGVTEDMVLKSNVTKDILNALLEKHHLIDATEAESAASLEAKADLNKIMNQSRYKEDLEESEKYYADGPDWEL